MPGAPRVPCRSRRRPRPRERRRPSRIRPSGRPGPPSVAPPPRDKREAPTADRWRGASSRARSHSPRDPETRSAARARPKQACRGPTAPGTSAGTSRATRGHPGAGPWGRRAPRRAARLVSNALRRSRGHRGENQSTLLEVREDNLRTLFRSVALRFDPNVRFTRLFVRIVDTGEPCDLALERLLVQTFDVAPRALLDRC